METALVEAVMRWAEIVSLQDSFRLFTVVLACSTHAPLRLALIDC